MRVLAHYSYLLAALVLLMQLLTRGTAGANDRLSVAVAVIAAMALMILGKTLTLLERRWQQHRRDRRAAALLARLLQTSGPVHGPPFVVYLRPFSTTARLAVANPKPRWLPILPSYFAHEATLEFETMLSEALPHHLPLVALGRPGEHFGAGRVAVSDEDWRVMFQRLVEDARWLVMIPSARGETRWELQQLVAQDCLCRTIFLMPPALKRGGIDMRSDWAQARAALVEDGVHLPAYTGAGQLFRLGRQGRFYRARYLPRLAVNELRDTFAGIAAD